MAEFSTLARPYAKAAFGAAQASSTLDTWSQALDVLAGVSVDPAGLGVIEHPTLSAQQKADWLNGLVSDTNDSVKQFVELLAENRRLTLFTEISAQFDELRRQIDDSAVAEVETAMALTDAQETQLVDVLSRHLNRQVTLNVTVNDALVGGVVVRVDDLVIDGSVRGKLAKLAEQLKP